MITFVVNWKVDNFLKHLMGPNQNNYNEQFPNCCDLIRKKNSRKKILKILTNLK